MTSPDDIINLIDAGLGRAGGWSAPIYSGRCSRAGCTRPPEGDHDFCGPCLAWLRSEVDDDPLGPSLPEDGTPDDVDPIVHWVELYGGFAG